MVSEKTKLPSQEKPWLRLFPEEAKKSEFPKDTIYNVIKGLSSSRLNNYAIDYYGNELTYGQFMEEVDIAAGALESLGVKSGDIIACNSATIPEMIVLLYASNKIGATMLAIDPRRTPSFIKQMVEESKAKLFFTIDVSYPLTKAIIPELDVAKTIIISPDNYLPFMLKTLKKLKDKKIDIDYSDSVINWKSFLALGKGKSSHTAKYGDNDVVAITFTGGTTGEPKGVMLTNDGFNSVYHSFKHCGVNYQPNQRFLNVIPAFSSYGVVASLHMPLGLGLEIVVIPKFDVNKVGYYIKKFKPAHTLLVPAHYEMLMNSKEMRNGFDLSFFETAGSGGDTMNVGLETKLNNFLKEHGCRFPLSQGYGMSEVSSAVSCCCNGNFKSLSVGYPLLNSVVSVFKPDTTEELGYNEEGEICMTGPSVMAGYFNNQAETDNIMRMHPDGKVWVHSGDIGYMDEDGYIFIKGRIKRMITRFDGHKIFPTTIEDAISRHPSVESCAVVDVKDKDHAQGMLALAVVQLAEGSDEAEIDKEIKKIIEKDLEERGRPSYIIYTDRMPHTSIGKIDYAKLSAEYSKKI
ncbi:MAG: class I adenylate-forming enzyme family protein [Acutalibacteraceae bacterium]